MKTFYPHDYLQAETYFLDSLKKGIKFIIIYGRGSNGKTHLIQSKKELTNDYNILFDYEDIQDLNNIACDKTQRKYILELRDSEELSYFEFCNSEFHVIDMNMIKY